MDYEFGDIIDCIKIKWIGHFVVVLGVTKKDEVMFFRVTSRVYKVFQGIVDFLNDCQNANCALYNKNFEKEKGKKINIHGNLVDALFLDKKEVYSLLFFIDSMILVNRDPEMIDKKVLDGYIREKLVIPKAKLAEVDVYKLVGIIKFSKNISDYRRKQIRAGFSKMIFKVIEWKKDFKLQNYKKT
ncbi:MAG: hypothetical protein PHS54_03440 [Clostridia bacterium]|nr:hypothetical protein [Clostridia bacterium]